MRHWHKIGVHSRQPDSDRGLLSLGEERPRDSPQSGASLPTPNRTIVTSDAYTTLSSAAYASLPANASASFPSWDEIEATYGTVYDAVSATVDEPTSLEEVIDYANNAVRNESLLRLAFQYLTCST